MSWKAEVARSKGNELFRAGSLEEALQSYALALQHAPADTITFANRSLVNLKLGRW